MEKLLKVYGCVAALFLGYAGFGQNIAGSWQGQISPKLRLVFHFSVNAAGEITATLDSPDQGATGIPCSGASLKGDSLMVELAVAHAAYSGRLMNDTTISGSWQQGGQSVPLVLKRTGEIKKPLRPQTPVPPFPYASENVEYDNTDGTVHLAGTLTYPAGKGPFPTAILISGSGQQDRDETIFDHKPFAVLADRLTRNGFAVLRVDDRGTGKSTGEVLTATSADFAADVRTSIRYLLTRPEVDKSRLGLIGHSEGGIIAPMVAANNPAVSFMVLWAAPIIGGLETNISQNIHALQSSGFAPAAVQAFAVLHRQQLNNFSGVADTSQLRSRVLQTFSDWRTMQPDSILSRLYVSGNNILGQNVYALYAGLYQLPWMRFFITHNFTADLAQSKAKVLAINGDLDTQVDAATNLAAIDSILTKSKQPHKTVTMPGLNHMLQKATTGEVGEYGQIEETISPQALDVITTWLIENVGNKTK